MPRLWNPNTPNVPQIVIHITYGKGKVYDEELYVLLEKAIRKHWPEEVFKVSLSTKHADYDLDYVQRRTTLGPKESPLEFFYRVTKRTLKGEGDPLM